MRNTIRYLSALTAFLVAGMAIHSPAAAQEAEQTLNAPTVTPAEQFEMRAHQQVSHDNWLPVAADLEKAARLRPANDPEALNDLMGAATLYSSVGRPSIALSILDEVARRAEHIGANDMAVRAYVGAIDLSEQVDENGQAAFYLSRLEGLARRPGVTQEQEKVVFGPLGLAPQHCN